LQLKEQQAKLDQLGGEKKSIGFGSQIRSYVLQPYQMIKDLRTRTRSATSTACIVGESRRSIHQGVSDEKARRQARASPAAEDTATRPARLHVRHFDTYLLSVDQCPASRCRR
jgi:hypothetical protein